MDFNWLKYFVDKFRNADIYYIAELLDLRVILELQKSFNKVSSYYFAQKANIFYISEIFLTLSIGILIPEIINRRFINVLDSFNSIFSKSALGDEYFLSVYSN